MNTFSMKKAIPKQDAHMAVCFFMDKKQPFMDKTA